MLFLVRSVSPLQVFAFKRLGFSTLYGATLGGIDRGNLTKAELPAFRDRSLCLPSVPFLRSPRERVLVWVFDFLGVLFNNHLYQRRLGHHKRHHQRRSSHFIPTCRHQNRERNDQLPHLEIVPIHPGVSKNPL